MTPEEEVKKLGKLIRQYETVYRTAATVDQRERVGKELKRLQSYRDKILAVNEIDPAALVDAAENVDELAPYPILRRLEAAAAGKDMFAALVEGQDDGPPPGQQIVSRILLYCNFFEKEYLPFLTEIRLKLDFKFSMERDGFYHRFQELKRKIAGYTDDKARLDKGDISRQAEAESRKRMSKLVRYLEVEASRFFGDVRRFADELVEDSRGDGVKCLNAESLVSFEKIEGSRHLEGRSVRDALEELADVAREAVEFLNVPDLETQENDRADRY
jgi:hypothetical protein